MDPWSPFLFEEDNSFSMHVATETQSLLSTSHYTDDVD